MNNRAIKRLPLIVDVYRRFDGYECASLFNVDVNAFLNGLPESKLKEAKVFGTTPTSHSHGFQMSTVSLGFIKNLVSNPDFTLVSMEIVFENGIEIDSDGVSEIFISVDSNLHPQVSVLDSLKHVIPSKRSIKLTHNCCYVFNGRKSFTYASLRNYLDNETEKQMPSDSSEVRKTQFLPEIFLNYTLGIENLQCLHC